MKAPSEGTNVIKCFKKYFNDLQLAYLQSRRHYHLHKLRNLVYEIATDKAMSLDTSWNAYFEKCLHWINFDGQTAGLSDIEERFEEAYKHVR